MDPFIGQITMFGGNFAPRGWAFCNGQLLAISQNSALFSILGTTYGGDGRTTFALPDLRGRAPIHSGDGSVGPGLSPRPLGQRGGEQTHTLNILEMPIHNHVATSTSKLHGQSASGDDDTISTGSSIASGSSTGSEVFSSQPPNTEMNTSSVTTATTTLNQGGSQPHNNMQPYLAINFIIALVGVFPSRN
ncbi:tail fiber protein [Tenacibaculum sp. 1B UA]|uniref:phage tail protein n=1 Tax=unclassified Tenacibaculum TaxID=2635139 RepID=UPI0026E2B433|nr:MULTISPECIES: tail fiber protein [unclassified Tenacibaculum]MDO6674869.1 tail fiber protein [Tenacibaculum sp. 1_MG-2023]MDX8553186.1 tail fiber protein [Tenacibaculum sp. 1B UA]